ncbi:MAG: GNAT family N-acetyltransferase [Paludibacterium sp.]|uniref:GNAT family N-acetyltransferase n=1 Tax=Paludibacterium sp. TaxID=1917523 RepID=UPI0025EFA7B5|nr:GNAT family N-acetyltransferase [Paludibacterium sp.]MBV8048389.1 GNAT family N-acetyltransferase [Paludibacterium sp.]MBV8649808.1 GNAT family N-acetyltransferase [Paludibacterium sp.]
MSLTAPHPLGDGHRLETFRCTEPELESWLKQRARKNQQDGASRCFVVCDDDTVVGFYALAAGSVLHTQATGSIRRNMPDPIPVVVLGRLAIHTAYQGRGMGADLLKDAVLRSLRLSREMGIRALLCHAIDENAKRFYLHHGFIASPDEPLTLMLNLAKLASAGVGK